MGNFVVEKTGIEGLLVIKSRVYGDSRGHFLELWNERSFSELGLDIGFVQDNVSRSLRGTLRGLHYQKTKPQGKLVGVIYGEVFDVAVDLRGDSATYGRWSGQVLDGESGTLMYVPPGFAHGFYVLSERADFIYKCSDFYAPEDEGGLLWNDPTVGVEWPLIEGLPLLMTEKDRRNPGFSDSFRW